MDLDMKKKWEVLHSQQRYRPKYPENCVVKFVFRNFKRDGNEKILDIGCGAGRHIYFMANENIQPYGVDISQEGVDFTAKILKENNLYGKVQLSSADKLSYETNYFDGIICYGVLNYCQKINIEMAIKEIYRVLKTGGKGLIVLRSKKDYRFGLGKKLDENTFVIEENNENLSAFAENGMINTFFERKELEQLFKDFKYLEINEISETCDNGEFLNCDYAIVIQK